jgi:hypothetical protein
MKFYVLAHTHSDGVECRAQGVKALASILHEGMFGRYELIQRMHVPWVACLEIECPYIACQG